MTRRSTRLEHAWNLDHRRLPRGDRCKPLHRVYPREIARGDIEPSVAQRSLERVHRNPLAGALHGKAVSECVGVDPTPQAARGKLSVVRKSQRPRVQAVMEAVKTGEFDATKEESDRWAASKDGQDTMALLLPRKDL